MSDSTKNINQKEDLITNLVGELENQDINKIKSFDPDMNEEVSLLYKKVEALRGRPLFLPYVGSGRGNGVYVELEDKSVKMDLVGGIGIHILGHSHPEIIKASLKASMSDIVMQGNLQMNQDWIRLSDKLVKLATRHSKLVHSWLTTSGTMANENALKMIFHKNTPARKIVTMKKAFAGRSMMMGDISDNPDYKVGLPSYNDVLRLDFYNPDNPTRSKELALSQLREHISKHPSNIAGFVFEIIQGEGGFRVAPRDFFVPLLEECKKNNIAIWADEVQTFARTGEFFAFETMNIGDYLDMVTIGKTPGIATTLFSDKYNPAPGIIAGTFAGSTVQMASGLKIIEILETGRFMGADGRVRKIYEKFRLNMTNLIKTTLKGFIKDINGMGLMIAITPYDGTKKTQAGLIQTFYKNGLITFGCGRDPYKIRLLPPAIISNDEIDIACKIIEKSTLEYHNLQ